MTAPEEQFSFEEQPLTIQECRLLGSAYPGCDGICADAFPPCRQRPLFPSEDFGADSNPFPSPPRGDRGNAANVVGLGVITTITLLFLFNVCICIARHCRGAEESAEAERAPELATCSANASDRHVVFVNPGGSVKIGERPHSKHVHSSECYRPVSNSTRRGIPLREADVNSLSMKKNGMAVDVKVEKVESKSGEGGKGECEGECDGVGVGSSSMILAGGPVRQGGGTGEVVGPIQGGDQPCDQMDHVIEIDSVSVCSDQTRVDIVRAAA